MKKTEKLRKVNSPQITKSERGMIPMVVLLFTPTALPLTLALLSPSTFTHHQLCFFSFLTNQSFAISGPSAQVSPLPGNVSRPAKLLTISLNMNIFSEAYIPLRGSVCICVCAHDT